MKQTQEKPHKFDIGEGYGIFLDHKGITQRSFPEEFLRAKNGDSAGKYKIGDFAIMNQPTTKRRFGMFVIANVETGDFGGTGLKYRITVKPYGTVEDLARAEARRSDMGGRSGPPATRLEKETKMKQTTYKMMKIRLADCKPHADAEAYSASTEDRAALANSVAEAGVLSPIAVIAADDDGRDGARPSQNGQKWYVIDGIGRMNALIEAGVEETEAQVFDLGDLSVAEFVVCKNSMMRKVTTGTRVMAYLKCHEREVLAAAKEESFRSRMGSKWRNGWEAAVSRDTAASDKGWSSKDIAERIGVSNKDVLAGIELLKAMATGEDERAEARRSDKGEGANWGARRSDSQQHEQGDLFETMEAVLRGETPIRRWKAAVSGKVSKVGGKAAADYTNIAIRTVKSLPGVWQHWQEVPMEVRGPIIAEFRQALKWLPEDFRAALEDVVESHAEAQRRGGRR